MVMSIEAGTDAFHIENALPPRGSAPQGQPMDGNANNTRLIRNTGQQSGQFRTAGPNCPPNYPQMQMQFSVEETAELLPFDAIISDALPSRLIPLLRAKHFFIQTAPRNFEEEFTSRRKIYNILDCNGERVFILEDMSQKTCCGCGTRLNIIIRGSSGNEIMNISGNPSGRSIMKMSTIQKPICSIEESGSCCSSEKRYKILDEDGRLIYKVGNDYGRKNTYEFEVTTYEGTRIGKLSKTWIGLPPREQTLAHSYGVAFPIDLLVQDKISLLGAMIILNLKYVEDRGQLQRRGESECLFCVLCFLLAFACFLIFALIGVLMYRDFVK